MAKGNISVDSENLFPIIKKWLYSDKDIFLRELVYNILREGGFAAIYEEYESLCITVGKEVVILKDGEEIPGVALGISPGV